MGEKKKKIIIISAISAGIVVLAVCFCLLILPGIQYNSAVFNLENGNYDEAIAAFSAMGDYQDAPEKLIEAKYKKAEQLQQEGNYREAAALCDELLMGEISDSQMYKITYLKASALFSEKNYLEARELFQSLGEYENAAEMVNECAYEHANTLAEEGELEAACAEFEELGHYKDAQQRAGDCYLQQLGILLNQEAEQAEELKTWIHKCLDRISLREQAEEMITNWMQENRVEGKADLVYEVTMDCLESYRGKFSEQAYQLAIYYLEEEHMNIEYAQQILEQLTTVNYKDAEELLLECDYQRAIGRMEQDPDQDAVIQDLYWLGQQDYKNSRELLESICTTKWIFEKLKFSNKEVEWVSAEEILGWDEYYGDYAMGFRQTFRGHFTVENPLPFPIKGKLNVKMTIAGESSETVSYTLDKLPSLGERKCETKTWYEDSFGDYSDQEDTLSISAKSLQIVY